MSKNMQMPVEFFNSVTELLQALEGEDISRGTQDIAHRVFEHLNAKLEAIEKREAFTAYKSTKDKRF